jgi:3-hydroxyisobutyrate dehydrogenase-like beta-hydroxyacid dehydrogenase
MMKSVGFIGLGTMGAPMAANLLKKGYPLTVYNRTAEKANSLGELGAEIVSSPSRVARVVDVLFTNVSDDQALLDVFFGADGILEGIHPGLTVIDCSTVSPDTSRKLEQELGVHYADFLDAPVTGSKPAAESGSLVFMVGGNYEVFTEQAELFATLGSKALYMGPSGAGSQSKLAHNTIVAINAAALAEGLAIATKSGIDPAQFLEIVQSGGANSRQAELKGTKIIDRDFSNQFSLALMLKDLLLAAKLTQSFQLPTPLLNAATSLYQIGLSKGLGDQDLSSVIQCYEDWMNDQVKRKPLQPDFGASSISESNRRRNNRVPMNIQLQLSVYQWEQEGSFSGQNISGVLYDLSESGLQIASSFPLAKDMFIVIHFPQEAELPPITGKIIRIEPKTDEFRYGCMLSGLPPYVRIKLEQYIEDQQYASELL